jgi:hypothetical protein
VDLELDEIVHEVAVNRPLETAWYDFTCLLAPDVILRTTMGILIQFFQQLCGINAFFYYSSIIFRDLGITPDTTTSITGAVSVAATFICCFYIERVGRRSLQIWGSIGMMYSLIVVGMYIYIYINILIRIYMYTYIYIHASIYMFIFIFLCI